MRRHAYLKTMLVACATTLALGILPAAAQPPRGHDRSMPAYRPGSHDRNIGKVVTRAERRSDDFRKLVDKSLDASRLDDTRREDTINARVKDMDTAIDRFNKLFDRRRNDHRLRSDFQGVLTRAAIVDRLVQGPRVPRRIHEPWRELRSDLDRIADFYRLRHVGDTRPTGWPRSGNRPGGPRPR